jgi:hypothetical protein
MENVLGRTSAKALSMPYQQVFEPALSPCFSGFFATVVQKTGGGSNF